MTDFSKLEADLAAEAAVVDGVVTLLGTLSKMIADLKAVAPDPTLQAHIDQLAAAVEANKQKLADAVTANTPAATAAPATATVTATTSAPAADTTTATPAA
jgi:hypothetical protein